MIRVGSHSRTPILIAAAVAILSYTLIWLYFKPIVFSTTKSDFSCFYRAGRMVIAGDGTRVYDLDAQRQYDKRLGTSFIDGQGREFSLPFVFPPYTLALFAPLSCLPYRAAEFVWYALNIGMLLALPFVLRNNVASRGNAIAGELLAPVFFLPAVLALMRGQPSILLLLLFAMAFATLAEGSDTAAGIILAFATFKPQLVLPMLLALGVWRKWRTLMAMAWASIALLGISAAIVGWRATLHYPRALLQFNRLSGALGGEHPESMPDLRGMLHVLMAGWPKITIAEITIVMSVLLLAIFAVVLKQKQSPAVSRSSYSLAIVVTCLLSYHAYLHDDCLLLLPIVLMAQHLLHNNRWTVTRTALAAAIGALYIVPVLPTSLPTTAIQMFAAMLMLAAVLGVEMRNAASHESAEPVQQQLCNPAFSR